MVIVVKRFLFYANRLPLASVDIHGYRDPFSQQST